MIIKPVDEIKVICTNDEGIPDDIISMIISSGESPIRQNQEYTLNSIVLNKSNHLVVILEEHDSLRLSWNHTRFSFNGEPLNELLKEIGVFEVYQALNQ